MEKETREESRFLSHPMLKHLMRIKAFVIFVGRVRENSKRISCKKSYHSNIIEISVYVLNIRSVILLNFIYIYIYIYIYI